MKQILLLLLLTGFTFCFVPAELNPEQALRTMQVPPGFTVQLFAAEPLVSNPTNMDVDDRGRVWLTESPNYDAAPQEFDQRGDQIVILEDTNGDGRADSRKVFFEHPTLNAPMGLALAPGRVYLAQSPYLLVLHDTDHDDKADRVDTLFGGFGGRDHGLHPPFFGPDGKLYFSIGNYGGQVNDRFGKLLTDRAGNPITVRSQPGSAQPYRNGLILRCNPDGSGLETLAHNFRNQFEPTIDSFGNLWVSDNDDDGNQSVRIVQVMDYGNYGFADERTGAAWPAYRTNLETTVPQRHWHQNDPGVVPNVLITGAGSPAGLTFYEGGQFPLAYRNQPLHAEALHNVVRFYPAQPQGAGYTARIANLLKSTDQWFRPVDVSVAPDGSVLVADWYDPGIGGGTAADSRKGRIYRIRYGPPKPYRFTPGPLTTPTEAAEALKSPNRYRQRAAYEQLARFGDKAELALLRLWQTGEPIVQARAFWLLSQLPDKADRYIQQALTHANPKLRVVGIRALRQQANGSLAPRLMPLAHDPNPHVRREVAIALRFDPSPEADALWATLAGQHNGRDRWYLEALGIGADLHANTRLAAYLKQVGNAWNTPAGHDILWRSRSAGALPYLANIIRATPDAAQTLRYFRAFDFHDQYAGAGPDKQTTLLALTNSPNPTVQRLALQQMDPVDLKTLPAAPQVALDRALLTVAGTADFVQLVQKFGQTNQREALLDIVRKQAGQALGKEALALLWQWNERTYLESQMQDETTARAVLEAFGGDGRSTTLDFINTFVWAEKQPLEVRKMAIRTIGSSWTGETYLLGLVKRPDFPEDLKPTAGSVLFGAYRNSIKREAAQYLPEPTGKGGTPLPPVYLLAYEKGNADAGQRVFTANCTVCHRAGTKGADFGPGLSTIGSKLSKEGLFRAILYPDEGVNHGYETYQIQTRDNNTAIGLTGSETDTELTLKLPGGFIQKIAKAQIVTRSKLDNSLMPAFGAVLSKDELVNLVAYLERLR